MSNSIYLITTWLLKYFFLVPVALFLREGIEDVPGRFILIYFVDDVAAPNGSRLLLQARVIPDVFRYRAIFSGMMMFSIVLVFSEWVEVFDEVVRGIVLVTHPVSSDSSKHVYVNDAILELMHSFREQVEGKGTSKSLFSL